MARRISHSRHLQNPRSLSSSLPAYSIECALLSFSPLSFFFFSFHFFKFLIFYSIIIGKKKKIKWKKTIMRVQVLQCGPAHPHVWFWGPRWLHLFMKWTNEEGMKRAGQFWEYSIGKLKYSECVAVIDGPPFSIAWAFDYSQVLVVG